MTFDEYSWSHSQIEIYALLALFMGINICICFQQYAFFKTKIIEKLDEKDSGINEKDLLQLLIHVTGCQITPTASPYFVPTGNIRDRLLGFCKNLDDIDREHVQHWIKSTSSMHPMLMDYNMLTDIGKELFLNEIKQLIIFYGKHLCDNCETVLDSIHMLESQEDVELSGSVAQQLLVRLNQTYKPLSFSKDSCDWLGKTFHIMFQKQLLPLPVYRHLQFGLYFLQQTVYIEDIEIL